MASWPIVAAVVVFLVLYGGYMLWMRGPNGPRQINKAIAGWGGRLLAAEPLAYDSLRHERYTEFWLVTYMDEDGHESSVRASTGLFGFQVLDESHPAFAAGVDRRSRRGFRRDR